MWNFEEQVYDMVGYDLIYDRIYFSLIKWAYTQSSHALWHRYKRALSAGPSRDYKFSVNICPRPASLSVASNEGECMRRIFLWSCPAQMICPLLLVPGLLSKPTGHFSCCLYCNCPNSWRPFSLGCCVGSANHAGLWKVGFSLGEEQRARSREKGSFSSFTVKICVNKARK